MFEADLIYMKRNFNMASYEELLEQSLGGHAECYKNCFVLSFDDGYSECFSVVRPLLLKYKIPCIFFIATDFIDNKHLFYRNKVSLCIERVECLKKEELAKFFDAIASKYNLTLRDAASFICWIKDLDLSREDVINGVLSLLAIDTKKYLEEKKPYLTTDEIKSLRRDGFTIGAHGKSHAKLGLLNTKDAEREISESCNIIRSLTGQRYVPFSFPFSSKGVDTAFLQKLSANNDAIKLFFDTRNLENEPYFRINRIACDVPSPYGATDKSNMPAILHSAYRHELERALGVL
jgi:peptidoglycan/xylan/chitin deacetylase (PgdA/CDA1 family)